MTKRIWPGGWRGTSRSDMCQWLGTEPEGENWVRGRALNVETSAVGSGWFCGEVVDMAGAGLEVDAPYQNAMWRGKASRRQNPCRLLGAGERGAGMFRQGRRMTSTALIMGGSSHWKEIASETGPPARHS